MKLTVDEIAEVEEKIARSEIDFGTAGWNAAPALVSPVSYADLIARRHRNLENPNG